MCKLMNAWFILVLSMLLCNCQSVPNQTKSNEVEEVSIEKETIQSQYVDIVNEFFTQFQQLNDGWTKTLEGHNKLKKAFAKKMTEDLAFAKSFIQQSRIVASESMSSYSKENGEDGELKTFDLFFTLHLLKPLYNGQKEIKLKYELFSTIPSTIENHRRPYVSNANYCATFHPFLNNQYDGALDLGCFIITKKEN